MTVILGDGAIFFLKKKIFISLVSSLKLYRAIVKQMTYPSDLLDQKWDVYLLCVE